MILIINLLLLIAMVLQIRTWWLFKQFTKQPKITGFESNFFIESSLSLEL
jgi:hypothetical protein